MNTIEVIARASIREGKLDEFKALAADCMQAVREREPGALKYDWFLDEARSECVVLETYKDSEAVLAHIANLGASLGALLALGDWTFEVCGSPSPELAAATAGLSLKVCSPFTSV